VQQEKIGESEWSEVQVNGAAALVVQPYKVRPAMPIPAQYRHVLRVQPGDIVVIGVTGIGETAIGGIHRIVDAYRQAVRLLGEPPDVGRTNLEIFQQAITEPVGRDKYDVTFPYEVHQRSDVGRLRVHKIGDDDMCRLPFAGRNTECLTPVDGYLRIGKNKGQRVIRDDCPIRIVVFSPKRQTPVQPLVKPAR